jgi:alpha-N-arabinofuranosidase
MSVEFSFGDYWGIPVRPNTRYRASFFAKAAPGFTGPITATIESEDGTTTFATGRTSGVTQAWKPYEVTLTTARLAPTAKARFLLTVDRPGTIWFGLVSPVSADP